MSILMCLLGALGEGILGLAGAAAFPPLAPLISVLTLAGPPLPLLLAPLALVPALAPTLIAPGCQIPPFQWLY